MLVCGSQSKVRFLPAAASLFKHFYSLISFKRSQTVGRCSFEQTSTKVFTGFIDRNLRVINIYQKCLIFMIFMRMTGRFPPCEVAQYVSNTWSWPASLEERPAGRDERREVWFEDKMASRPEVKHSCCFNTLLKAVLTFLWADWLRVWFHPSYGELSYWLVDWQTVHPITCQVLFESACVLLNSSSGRFQMILCNKLSHQVQRCCTEQQFDWSSFNIMWLY